MDLVELIIKKHPEILTYYELSNYTEDLDVRGITKAYGMHERYHTEFKTAVRATYLAIKKMAKRKETLERLTQEYQKNEFSFFG